MMSRVQVILLHISLGLTALTGIVFAVMKYGMKSDDPFSVANHPMQPTMLAIHVVIAPVAVFALGWAFGNHMWPAFRNRAEKKRPSGVWSMLSVAPMVLSGYLLQVSTAEELRKAMVVAHWVTSAFFVVAFTIHVVLRQQNNRESPAP
jgi:uncharacterized membrane protein YidH (DUF202 family)